MSKLTKFAALDIGPHLFVQAQYDGKWMQVGSCGGSGKFDSGWTWTRFDTDEERQAWLDAKNADIENASEADR